MRLSPNDVRAVDSMLSAYSIPPITDITSRHEDGRASEIKAYLDSSGRSGDSLYVILDDQPILEKGGITEVLKAELVPHMLLIDPAMGLTGSDASKALAILRCDFA